MRYLVGNIKKDSIQTLAVGPDQMKLNDMAEPPLAEHPVTPCVMSCPSCDACVFTLKISPHRMIALDIRP